MKVGDRVGRKYADKLKWKKAVKKDYRSIYIEDKQFIGYAAGIKFLEIEGPMKRKYFGKDLTLIDRNYIWLELFPLDKKHCITAKYNDKREIVKWYIDIVSGVGLDRGVPYMEDMYLDLDLLPSGEMEILDEDELEEAYRDGKIDEKTYRETKNSMEDFLRQLDINSLTNLCDDCLGKLNF